MERTDTVVVGGEQAGIAMSEHLGRLGIAHVVLERARIAKRWRSARRDSLVANGPAWHDRFPGMEFPARRGRSPPRSGLPISSSTVPAF
jgi:putative flavoprotein involved in K+ transport